MDGRRAVSLRHLRELVREIHGYGALRSADGLDLARIKVTSPVTRLLRLSLGQWLAGLAGHQRRHLWQARQVKTELLG